MSNDIPTRRVADREVSGLEAANPNDIATRRVGMPTPAVEPPIDPNIAATRRVREENTAHPRRVVASTAQRPLGALPEGTVICGDCIVLATRQNHETQRPGLFECRSPDGHVMVKVAAVEHPPHPALWTKLPTLRHPHVLKVFRTLEDGGRYYEIQEFCGGGTLEELVPYPGSGRPIPPVEWIERALVPAFATGIQYLHDSGTVHRDIKPSNIYFREEAGKKIIVLGDFDISATLDTGRTSRSTQRAAGTWNYCAPEAFPRFVDDDASKMGSAISRACDYYSFGVVLVELLTGTTSLHQAQFPDLFDFYLQGGRVEIPAGLPGRITELLQGLLLRNRNLRWGHAELQRWMANATTEADRRRIRDDGGYRFGVSTQPYNAFERSKPTSLRELADAMREEPGIALEELMSGDVLLNWIGNLDSKVARQIRKQREQWRAMPQLVYIYTGGLLAPELSWPLRVTPKRLANNAAEWAAEATAAVKEGAPVQELCSTPGLNLLETWLRLKVESEPEMADAVATIRAASTKHGLAPAILLEELSYAFSPQKAYVVANGVVARSPQEVARKVYGEPQDWQGRGNSPSATYSAAFKRWQGGSLEAWLRQRLGGTPEGKQLVDQCTAVRMQFKDAPFAGFEVVLRLLDPTLPPVQLDLETAPLTTPFVAEHGQEITRTVAYRTKGPGMPYGAWGLEDNLPGLQLAQHQVTERFGNLTVRLESANEIPTGRNHNATLKLDGRFVALAQGEVPLQYRVNKGFSFNPVWMQPRVLRAAGILIGVLVFFGIVARAVVMEECRGWLARPVTLQGHSGSIADVAFAPDGKTIVTGSQDASAKIWSADMGPKTLDWSTWRTIWGEAISNRGRYREAARTIAEGQPISAMALAPSGQRLAVAHADNRISIWNLKASGDTLSGRLTGDTGQYNEIESLAFSNNGDVLASGYRNGTIETWSTRNWSVLTSWTGHMSTYAGVKDLEFTSNDAMLASASDDSNVSLWNMPGKQKYSDFRGESEWARATAIAPVKPLVALGNDAHSLHIFDWRTKGSVGAFSFHTGGILALAFSPDGKLLASGGADRVLAIWDTSNWSVLRSYNEPAQVTAVAFSPDGSKLVSGQSDGGARIWQVDQMGLK